MKGCTRSIVPASLVLAAQSNPDDCHRLYRLMQEEVLPRMVEEACGMTGTDPVPVANRVGDAFTTGSGLSGLSILRVQRSGKRVTGTIDLIDYAIARAKGRDADAAGAFFIAYLRVYINSAARESRPRHAQCEECDVAARQLNFTQEDREELDACIDKLPDQHKIPLRLYYIEDLTLDQVAQRVGVSNATVRRRIEKGRARLREIIEVRG